MTSARLLFRSVCLCLLALSVSPARAQSKAVTFHPTTTLAAETGNNTSAAPNFQGFDNGDPAGSNVSKVSLRDFIPSGTVGMVLAQYQPWFGSKDHKDVGYRTDDSAQVRRQVDDMLSRGIEGVVLAWYGSLHKIEDDSSRVMMKEAERRNGAFHFAIEENKLALNRCSNGPCTDKTQKLIDDLNSAARTYYDSPAYLRVNGRPLVCFFDVDGDYNLDWARVRRSVKGNPLFLFRKDTGFSHPESDGAFAWRGIAKGEGDMGLADVDAYTKAAKDHHDKVAIGAVYKGFDDHVASWTGHKFVDQHCGGTWLASIRAATKQFSSSHPLPFLQIVTWNDYEEGTEIETGVDNCVQVTASADSSRLAWRTIGDRATIHHYTVFASLDGKNLMPIADVPASVSNMRLGELGLAPGHYSLFIKAVGQPSILNHMSPPVSIDIH